MLERAATVSELAAAVGRPKSTVAHHVNVLVDAGMLKVVRTRRVRAIDERFYGRTARLFYVGVIQPEQVSDDPQLARRGRRRVGPRARGRRAAGHPPPRPDPAGAGRGVLGAGLRRSSTSSRSCPASGDTVYGFVAGLYPTDHPTLPDGADDPA